MSDDILLVRDGATVLGGANDLGEEFARFLERIDPNGDNHLDSSEFIGFINSL